jgi:excisionase family DNA binding protein
MGSMDVSSKIRKKQGVKPERRRAFGVPEIADEFGVSASLIRLEIQRGNLRAFRFGQRVLVSAESLESYLASREGAK